MSWLAVDKGGCEHIFAEKPCRNESNTLWICSVVYLYGQRYANTGCCYLPKGSIKKLIGRELSWSDEPVELKLKGVVAATPQIGNLIVNPKG